ARLLRVVIEHGDAGAIELAVEIGTRLVRIFVARLEVHQTDLEGCNGHRPDDAGLVVARLDDGADQPRDADPVGAHLHRDHAPVWPPHPAPHGFGILGGEEETMADLHAATRCSIPRRYFGFDARRIVLLV